MFVNRSYLNRLIANLKISNLLIGIGVIHCNCEVDDQCEMVSQTKNFRNGFIMEPITMGPTATVQMVMELKEEKGFSTVPITQNGSRATFDSFKIGSNSSLIQVIFFFKVT